MKNRLPESAVPFSKVRKKAKAFVSRLAENVTAAQIFWSGFAFLCIITTFLINNPFMRSSVEFYREGDIAREDFVAPADIFTIDETETEKIRQSARETIQPIFTEQTNLAEEAVQSFRSAWESLQRKQGVAGNTNSRSNQNARPDLQWTGAGGAELGKIFSARAFSTNELESVVRILRDSAGGQIYGDQDRQYFAAEITLVDRQRPNLSKKITNPESSMTALSKARENLKNGLNQVRSFSEKENEAFTAALSPLIQPSIVYDSVQTENAREAIVRSVAPVTISLKRGEKVVDEGKVITKDILQKISAIRTYSSTTRQTNRFVGLLILISALFWVAWKFIEHNQVGARLALSAERSFALFGFVVIIQTALLAISFRIADYTAAMMLKAPLTDPMIWSFAIPFAFGSLLMTLLADRRTALFTGLFLALLTGLIAPKPMEFTIFSALAAAVAVYGIGRYRSRQSVTIAGVLVGLASAAASLAIIGYTQQPFILNTVLLSIACGLASGLATAAVTAVFLPMCENVFGVLTDVKLLELSNADLPALGQLALRAPGTNQHSHAVGQLAEEACRAVGANGLLARIGALYHDIGKSAAPEHFVENQLGKNPHDRLKPVQSAKIIISHVTYGVKLGKEMGLPQRIIDFIPQHHGTRTLHYFLRKAQAEARDPEEISENDFRYPGPKPQFREAAIMMIADSCEAAARSLQEPNPENIRFIVTKIIDAILADDQLDACDLTLRELTIIRESMIKSLVAIYHSRVDYPGYTPPNSSQKILIPAEADSEERGMLYKNPAEIPISPGGEVEDEAVERSKPPDKAEAKTVK